MKKSTLIPLFGILSIVILSACSSPSYLGKSYAPTQNVDVYLNAADIKKLHTTMGTSSYDQNFNSLDAMQQKLIEMGKAKGADGVIMDLTEEVAVTQQSGTGTINTKKKNNTVSTSSTTTNIKKKKITATFIKYD